MTVPSLPEFVARNGCLLGRAAGSCEHDILPKELLARLKLEKGDAVYGTEAANGAVMMPPYNAEFEAQMLFLWLNGWRLNASDADCVLTMINLAGPEIANSF